MYLSLINCYLFSVSWVPTSKYLLLFFTLSVYHWKLWFFLQTVKMPNKCVFSKCFIGRVRVLPVLAFQAISIIVFLNHWPVFSIGKLKVMDLQMGLAETMKNIAKGIQTEINNAPFNGVGYVTEKLYMLLQLYIQNKGWNPSVELLQCFTELKEASMLPSASYLQ